MTRLPNGLGRTIFIAALAGVMFAGFLLVTPRLTASSRDGEPATTTTVPPTTTSTTLAPVTTTTTRPAVTTTTTLPVDPEAVTPENGYDGTVTLGVYFEGDGGGKEYAELHDGGTIKWRLHVVNSSDEKLWGVFAYLELNGPAACEDHILDPGESTDCWVTGPAADGAYVAEAWVNAWTLTAMVKDKVFVDFVVLP